MTNDDDGRYMNIKIPFPFQRECIELGVRKNAYYSLASGLGKTISAIETYKSMRARGMRGPCLVVIFPKAAIDQWADAIEQQDPNKPYTLLDDADVMPEFTHNGYYLAYYEYVRQWAERLSRNDWLLVVADEAHRTNNRHAGRTKALHTVAEYAVRRIAMSATPMEKSPADMWAVFNWLYPDEFSSYWEFAGKYAAKVTGYGDTVTYLGSKPETRGELARTMRPFVVRKTKQEVAKDMPPQIETVVPIRMLKQQQALHDSIRFADDIIVDLDDGEGELSQMIIANTIARIVRLQQMGTDPLMLKRDVPSAKMEWATAFVEDNRNQQILVFSRFAAPVRRLAKELGGALIIGGQKPSGVKEFRAGTKQVLCGTIAAMGTALDFPMASSMVFLDTEYSSILMSQAIERIHRLGITEAKNLYYLENKGSIDRLVRDCVRFKWNDARLVYEFLRREREERQHASR